MSWVFKYKTVCFLIVVNICIKKLWLHANFGLVYQTRHQMKWSKDNSIWNHQMVDTMTLRCFSNFVHSKKRKCQKILVHNYVLFFSYQDLVLSLVSLNKASSAQWWLFYFSFFSIIPLKLIIRKIWNQPYQIKYWWRIQTSRQN